jgi:DNA primase
MEIKEEGIREKMLLTLIESVLGKGRSTARNNAAFTCPFCHHSKPKLELQIRTNDKKENPWHCWSCDEKGKTVSSLFKKLKAPQHKIQDLYSLIKPGTKQETVVNALSLPKEFIPLSCASQMDGMSAIEAKHAIKFLKQRGITENDVLKYNIGFCANGNFAHRIVVPSYDEHGNLNYFSTRTYRKDEPQKYKNPPAGRNIIGWEYYINWNVPLILVEGIFDALTIKRNVIPLFGKSISEELMKKIVGSQVQKVYIALDNDALKDAIKHCEKLLSYGKEVYLVELDGKDANEIGFTHFLDILEQTQPLTFSTLISKKIELI